MKGLQRFCQIEEGVREGCNMLFPSDRCARSCKDFNLVALELSAMEKRLCVNILGGCVSRVILKVSDDIPPFPDYVDCQQVDNSLHVFNYWL